MPARALSTLDVPGLHRLLHEQDGVVSRRQLATVGASRADVRRMLARRELVERVADHFRWVQDHRRPPRATFDFAVLKAASARDEAGAVALLSDAVHQGLTTAPRLLGMIAQLPRPPRRVMLAEVLQDVEAGTRSVLELRYLDATLDDHLTLRPGWVRACGTACAADSGASGPT